MQAREGFALASRRIGVHLGSLKVTGEKKGGESTKRLCAVKEREMPEPTHAPKG